MSDSLAEHFEAPQTPNQQNAEDNSADNTFLKADTPKSSSPKRVEDNPGDHVPDDNGQHELPDDDEVALPVLVPNPTDKDDELDEDFMKDDPTEEKEPIDEKTAADMELIKNSVPSTPLEHALSGMLERKMAHILRLTNEIKKLKTFISKRKQVYKRKRKDEGAPTRALSAYNIYVQDRFAQLAKENEKALSSTDSDAQLKRVPPANLVASTGNQWKALPGACVWCIFFPPSFNQLTPPPPFRVVYPFLCYICCKQMRKRLNMKSGPRRTENAMTIKWLCINRLIELPTGRETRRDVSQQSGRILPLFPSISLTYSSLY
jgi:hypothetical protein